MTFGFVDGPHGNAEAPCPRGGITRGPAHYESSRPPSRTPG
jgi:hypothetical protein